MVTYILHKKWSILMLPNYLLDLACWFLNTQFCSSILQVMLLLPALLNCRLFIVCCFAYQGLCFLFKLYFLLIIVFVCIFFLLYGNVFGSCFSVKLSILVVWLDLFTSRRVTTGSSWQDKQSMDLKALILKEGNYSKVCTYSCWSS